MVLIRIQINLFATTNIFDYGINKQDIKYKLQDKLLYIIDIKLKGSIEIVPTCVALFYHRLFVSFFVALSEVMQSI